MYQPKTLIYLGLWLALISPALFPAFAGADDSRKPFNINRQSLQQAIAQLSEQADLEISYPANLVEGLTVTGLHGQYTVKEALAKLLAGTGLTPRLAPNHAYTIEKAPAPYLKVKSVDGGKPQPHTQLEGGEGQVMPKVIVEADSDNPYDDPNWATDPYNTDYNRPNASTATKTDTKIMETPVNIQVVPQQVLKDQQAFRLDQALRNVSGVYTTPMTTWNGAGERFNLRGFNNDEAVFRNGFRLKNVWAGTGPLETANLDRIEVLKGPASILFGRIEPGGLVNLVPKQPLTTPYYSLQQQFGSFDLYRTTLDATGPISNDDKLLYRVNLAYENAGSFVDFQENERIFLAPTLRWDISPATQATFELQYKHSRDPRRAGIPALGDQIADLPRNTNLGEPFNHVESDDIVASFNWSHAFNDNWKLRHNFYADWTEAKERLVQISFDNSFDAGAQKLKRDLFNASFDTQTYATNMDLTGNFDTWGLKHTLLLGGDYYNLNVDYANSDVRFTSIDLHPPVHGGGPTPDPDFDSFGANQIKEEWYGFYLQDQIQLPFHFHLLAGFRYDHADYSFPIQSFSSADDTIPDFESSNSTHDEAVKPRFGLLWQPIPEFSVYGNYVENFGGPNAFGRGAGDVQLKSETAQQWEVGVKTELFDQRFTGSLAWFDLTKQNISTPDPFNPLINRLTGEARNQGLELDLAGELLPGWRMIGAYAYIDSEITKDTEDEFGNPTGNQGNRFFNVPRHGGSFWTSYEFQQGPFKGFKFGGGIVARSDSEGDNENSYQLPGYIIGNLLLAYEYKVGATKLTTQLNIENITDETYFAGSSGVSYINAYGAPRTFLGSIRIEF